VEGTLELAAGSELGAGGAGPVVVNVGGGKVALGSRSNAAAVLSAPAAALALGEGVQWRGSFCAATVRGGSRVQLDCAAPPPLSAICSASGIEATVSFSYEPAITGALAGAFLDVNYAPPLSLPGSGTERSVRDRFTVLTTQPQLALGLRDCDEGAECPPQAYTGLNPVRASILMIDNSGASPARLPTGRIASMRFDCPEGTLVRIGDLPCAVDGASDGPSVLPVERVQAENIRCVVDGLAPAREPTTTTTTTTSTTGPPSTTTSTTTTTTITIPCNNNGVTEGLEQCDDGNTIDEDDCVDCRINVCGDGVPDRQGPVTEECDDGNRDDADGCTNACTVCGNRTIKPPETCDDGNLANDDFCPGDCKVDFCQPTLEEFTATIQLNTPDVAALTVSMDYPEGQVNLQGVGGDIPPGILVGPGTATTQGFDFEHTLRVVAFDVFNFGTTTMATVKFNGCQGAPPPLPEAFDCRLEGTATDENFAVVPGVSCTVSVQ
jgi:cysteine-rich repeat protein